MQKRVLIAEDHPIIITGLKQMIKNCNRDCEIEETDSCEGLMNLVHKIKPQYCLIDLHLTDGIATECIENILASYPEINVMVYTVFPGSLYAKKLFQLGIHGFLNKKAPESELQTALCKFLEGEFYISADFLPLIFTINKSYDAAKINPFDFLSLKEIALIEYLREGISVKEISDKMAIMPNTASTYKKRAFEKLKIENIVQLTQLYLQFGGQSHV